MPAVERAHLVTARAIYSVVETSATILKKEKHVVRNMITRVILAIIALQEDFKNNAVPM